MTSPPRYEVTYHFIKQDGSSSVEYPVTVDTQTPDASRHKEDAYHHLVRMVGLSSVDEARKNWESRRIGVGFANEPWADSQELEQALESLPGVQSIRYDPPSVQDWHPSRYILTIDGGRGNDVVAAVNQYYEGMNPRVRNGRTVVVGVSPLS